MRESWNSFVGFLILPKIFLMRTKLLSLSFFLPFSAEISSSGLY